MYLVIIYLLSHVAICLWILIYLPTTIYHTYSIIYHFLSMLRFLSQLWCFCCFLLLICIFINIKTLSLHSLSPPHLFHLTVCGSVFLDLLFKLLLFFLFCVLYILPPVKQCHPFVCCRPLYRATCLRSVTQNQVNIGLHGQIRGKYMRIRQTAKTSGLNWLPCCCSNVSLSWFFFCLVSLSHLTPSSPLPHKQYHTHTFVFSHVLLFFK